METLNKCIRYIFFGKTDVSYPSARKKSDLNEVLPDNWSFIEDPLKKNLADYLIDNNITKSKENQNFWLTNSSPPLTSFLDEYRMEKANRSVYNDEFKFCSAHWHTAKSELTENNSVGNQTVDREVVKSSQPINIDMNPKIHDCYQAASQCSSKLEELKLRLSNKTQSKRDNKTYIRKPKKQFVEASSIEDGYEEPFEPDDLDLMGNVDYIEFNNFGSVIYENLHQVDAALMKIEDDSKQHKEMSIMKFNKNEISDSDLIDTSSTVSRDKEAFPKEKRKRNRKKACKFFRIPSQNSDSEAASSFEQSPVMFKSHIDLPSSCDQTPSSLELPISFRQNLSSESLENRKLSTTESEDSFIQFCDNDEDSCSESSVFDSNDEDYDYDSDSDSDVESGDITSALSKSVSNLTDDILYAENTKSPVPDEDQVDCAKREQEIEESKDVKSAGILVNSAKKLANKDKPHKTVRFSSAPPRVKVMRVWAFAARCARAGHWERYVADRDRFKKRTGEVEAAISWVFDPKHREKMFNKITLWKTADDESTEKKAINGSEERHNVREHIQEVTGDDHSTPPDPGKGAVVKCLETRHSDGLTKLEVPAKNVHIVDDKLTCFAISLCKDDKNAQEHADADFSKSIVEESIVEDSKEFSESDAMNSSEYASEKEVNCSIRPLNTEELKATNKKEVECVRSKCKNDNHVTSSSISQIIQKEDTLIPVLGGAEECLESKKNQMEMSSYLTEETNIVEDFIIPTHKLNIQFSPEVNFVVRDSRIRLDNFMKKNGASNIKNCEANDNINQMFTVKTV